jgi:hypothetical protein
LGPQLTTWLAVIICRGPIMTPEPQPAAVLTMPQVHQGNDVSENVYRESGVKTAVGSPRSWPSRSAPSPVGKRGGRRSSSGSSRGKGRSGRYGLRKPSLGSRPPRTSALLRSTVSTERGNRCSPNRRPRATTTSSPSSRRTSMSTCSPGRSDRRGNFLLHRIRCHLGFLLADHVRPPHHFRWRWDIPTCVRHTSSLPAQ